MGASGITIRIQLKEKYKSIMNTYQIMSINKMKKILKKKPEHAFIDFKQY